MQNIRRKSAVVLTLIAAVIVTIMRVAWAPEIQDPKPGLFRIGYIIMGVILVAAVATFILTSRGKREYPAVEELQKGYRMKMAYSVMFFGSILFVSMLYDCWRWLFLGRTPPPNESIINGMDGLTLFLTLVLGVAAAIFLIWMGIMLAEGRVKKTSSLSLAALLPVVWIWVRLVRYEVSYASAIHVSQSFFDFMMLIFAMLFLFAYARYISGTGARSPRMLLVYALCTALLSLSGTATEMILYVTRTQLLSEYSRLAGFADFGVGVFALFVAIALAFCEKKSVENTQVETILDTPAEGSAQ